jgi:hypothetical protein
VPKFEYMSDDGGYPGPSSAEYKSDVICEHDGLSIDASQKRLISETVMALFRTNLDTLIPSF